MVYKKKKTLFPHRGFPPRHSDALVVLVGVARRRARVALPIAEILQEYYDPRRSRIWWCPTAEFTLLPLHAAGSLGKANRRSPIFVFLPIRPT